MRKPKKQKQKKPNDKKAAGFFLRLLCKMGKREPKIGSRFLKEDIGKKKN